MIRFPSFCLLRVFAILHWAKKHVFSASLRSKQSGSSERWCKVPHSLMTMEVVVLLLHVVGCCIDSLNISSFKVLLASRTICEARKQIKIKHISIHVTGPVPATRESITSTKCFSTNERCFFYCTASKCCIRCRSDRWAEPFTSVPLCWLIEQSGCIMIPSPSFFQPLSSTQGCATRRDG